MKTHTFLRAVAAALLVQASAAFAQGPQQPLMAVAPEKSNGVYELNEPIAWRVEWLGSVPPSEVSYVVKKGGLTEVGHGTAPLTGKTGRIEWKSGASGALLVEVTGKTPRDHEVTARGGAIVDPANVKPTLPRPDDFDKFWAVKIDEIKKVPVNPQLEKKESGKEGVDYYHVTLDGYRGSHIHGQLARPSEAKAGKDAKFPALFIPQWAGVYPLDRSWAVDRAADGWLCLNVIAHDIPIQEPPAFYQEQSNGPLKDYPYQGNDNRETSYFLRMYLSCYQSLEYLRSRPDWDGKVLVVSGDSQGGMQTLVSAAIHPGITAGLALVPAGCDELGRDVGREAGWPKWMTGVFGHDLAKMREASRYYDVVNFASRIKCPMLIGYGLVDDVCPPEGVQAAINQIKSPIEVVVLPLSGHQEVNHSQQPFSDRRYGAWFPALMKGEAPPIRGAKSTK